VPMQCRTGSLRVPFPSFGGWFFNRQEFSRHCFVLTNRIRVAPIAPDGPGSKPAPAMDAAPSGDQNPSNITALYHKYLESRCIHTQTHTDIMLSVDP
jgi:hypothetical protein